MRCSTCRELLLLYAGGDLARDVARSVREHLDHCYYCNETLTEIRDIEESARTALVHPSPASVDEGLSRLLEAVVADCTRSRRRRRAPAVMRQALAWAAMVLVALSVSYATFSGFHAVFEPYARFTQSIPVDIPRFDEDAEPRAVPTFPLLAHLERIEEAQFRSPYAAQ